MGDEIHKKGDLYRIRTSFTDSYITTPLSKEQIFRYYALSNLRSFFNSILDERGSENQRLCVQLLINNAEEVIRWEKGIGNKNFNGKFSKEEEIENNERVLQEKELLLYLAQNWEKINELELSIQQPKKTHL
ncbi:MAG: hypothetical protein WCO58_02505 [bacterium]